MSDQKPEINTKINFGSQAFKKYFKNTSWLLTERTVRLIISFLINVYVIRYLGPDSFGLLSYAISFAALFTTLSTLGADNILVRELVKEPEKKDNFLGSVFVMKIFGSVSSFVLIAIVVLLTGESSVTITLIFLVAASTLFQSFNVIDFFFQSKVEAKFPVIVQFTTAILTAAFKFLLIMLNADLWLFAAAITLESFFWAAGFILVYKKQGLKIFNWQFNKEVASRFLKDSWPLILSGVVIAIYMRIDQVMIQKMLTTRDVGFYAAAARISEAWYFIPTAITVSLFPAIVNAKKISEVLYMSRLQKLYDILTWMAIGIAVPVTIFSDLIIEFVLGAEYLLSAEVLTIHIWAGVAVFLGVASGQYLITENLTKLAFYRTFIGMVLNIILNFVLIPVYGITGSAVATLVSYSVSVFSIGIDKRAKGQFILMSSSLIFINLINRLLFQLKKKK